MNQPRELTFGEYIKFLELMEKTENQNANAIKQTQNIWLTHFPDAYGLNALIAETVSLTAWQQHHKKFVDANPMIFPKNSDEKK